MQNVLFITLKINFKNKILKSQSLIRIEYLYLRVILLTELMLILFVFSTIICEYETC